MRALVEVVRGIGGEVRVLAVGSADHAVLVVTEVGRAHPDRTLLFEHVALRPQAVDRLVDEARLAVRTPGVERALAEEDVEVDVELLQRCLQIAELQLVGAITGDSELLVGRERKEVGHRAQHPLRQIVDVRPGVAVLRRRLALRGRQD